MLVHLRGSLIVRRIARFTPCAGLAPGRRTARPKLAAAALLWPGLWFAARALALDPLSEDPGANRARAIMAALNTVARETQQTDRS